MKNLTRLAAEYGLPAIRRVLPHMDAVFDLHFEKNMTFREISEQYDITYEDALLAVECAVALDVLGQRWHRQFG